MSDKPSQGWIRRILFFLRFLEIRLRFVFILVITALVVGYWDHVENYYERWQRGRTEAGRGKTAEDAGRKTEFYCPMHPFVVRNHPDKCPICGMDLSRREKGAAEALPAGVLARVQASPDRILQAGMQVEPVAYRLLSRTVRSYGLVETDETRVSRIVARFPGRVEALEVDSMGRLVKQGDPLLRIYSPKFLAAAQEFVQALDAARRIETQAGAAAEDRRRAAALAGFARERLILAGFTPGQLDAIARNGRADENTTLFSPLTGTVMEKDVLLGQVVEEGTTLYTIADLTTLWVQAFVAEADLGAVHVGMPVEISTVSRPGEIFYGTVDFIAPTVGLETRSGKVRVVVRNPDGRLKPGMYANAVFSAPLGQVEAADTATTGGATAAAKPGATPAQAPALPTRTLADARRFIESLPAGTKYYACPMDPEVVSSRAEDECPICGMRLEEKAAPALAAPAATQATSISLPTQTEVDAQLFLGSLPAGTEYFVCPMHPEVVSSRAADECPKCGMRLEEKTLSAPAAAAGVTGGQWAEGYACSMHLDRLTTHSGVCTVCNCGMEMRKWRIERVLAVPESAVIDTGERFVVYVQSAPGVFESRAVVLGARAGEWYPVLDGLREGQLVVAKGAFLIDAEARLNPAAAQAP